MRLTIRAKLFVIFFSLGLLPLLISVSFGWRTMSHAMVRQSNAQITKLANKTAEQIQLFFDSREKEIMLLANYPFVQLAFLQFEFGQRLDTVARLLTAYETRNRYFNNIYLTNLKGETILVVPRERKNTLPGALRFPRTPAGASRGDLKTLYVAARDNNGIPAVFMSRQVYDFEDPAKPVGRLTFDITPEAFTRFVASVKIGRRGYACLWDDRGLPIYHPERAVTDMDSFFKKGDKNLEELMQRIIRGERGQGNYVYKGVEKRMIFTPCRVLDWRVSISLEVSELMVDVISLRHRMITFCGVLTLLLLLASYVFGKSLSMPIHRIIEGSRAIGGGNLDHFISVDSGDELQDLADAFNAMSGKLRESRKMEAKMVRLDRLASLGELSAGMAHEIRNPLAGMKTATQILGRQLSGTSEKVLIQGILSEIDRLNKIVTDLLNYARPTPPMPQAVTLSQVVEKSLSLVRKSLKQNNIGLVKALNKNLPPALVDRRQVEQIFLNILLNAIKAMPKGGTLTITSTWEGEMDEKDSLPLHGPDRIEITFQDTGKGIPAHMLSRIFNPFFTTDPGGTGLGLSIVQKLMEENQGEVFIHSRENQGTRVTLFFKPCRSADV